MNLTNYLVNDETNQERILLLYNNPGKESGLESNLQSQTPSQMLTTQQEDKSMTIAGRNSPFGLLKNEAGSELKILSKENN